MNQVEPVMPSIELIRRLADGDIHSGQDLASVLGVSRTAIWKQLAKFESIGISLESQSGKGYRINGGLDLFDANLLATICSQAMRDLPIALEVLQVIDSTNAYLLRKPDISGVAICLAEMQTAGRGRRGRTWISPFGANIYLSIGLTLDGGIASMDGLSLAVGVWVVRALASLGFTGLSLKWPNDILWKQRKLGGILIEVAGDPSGVCRVVIGLGLNKVERPDMAANIEQPWVSLAEMNSNVPTKNELAAAIIGQIVPALINYQQSGFSFYKSEWEALNCHAGALVEVKAGAQITFGTVEGVNDVGALVLKTAEGRQVFHGGEVSLRGAQ